MPSKKQKKKREWNYIVDLADIHKGIITFLHQKRMFGYIQDYSGYCVFFHVSGVCNSDFKDLREGMEVEYIVQDFPKGKRAIGVVIL